MMVSMNKNINPLEEFNIKGVQSKEVREFKYLGCTIT